MDTSLHPPTGSRREVVGWCMYDFANSAYAACVQVVVFAVYFAGVVVPPDGVDLGPIRGVSGEALWGWAVGASMLVVAVAAPILGATADYSGRKRAFLFGFCMLGCLATGLMALVGPGDVGLAIGLLILGTIGMAGGNAFYNAFLPQIVPAGQTGRTSGWAWGLGYAGSAASLLMSLAIIQKPAWFGIPTHGHLPVRVALWMVAVWWLLFALPTFLWVRERPGLLPPDRRRGVLRLGWKRVLDTLRHVRAYPQVGRFLLAFFLYNDGVQTVILVSAVFGRKILSLGPEKLIVIFLAVQLIAIPGTLVAGYLADRLGHKRVVLASLAVWALGTAAAYWVADEAQYWVLSLTIGLVLGSVQAASRSLFARLIPSEHSAEFFGFYAVAGKFASILGPIVFGLVAYLTSSVRAAVFWILPFFLLGIVLLVRVREPASPD